MRFHYQNLNEKGSAGGKTVTGSVLRAGRAWLHLRNNPEVSLNWEWHLLTKRLAASVDIGEDEDAIRLSLSLILFSFYLSLECWRLSNWLSDKTKRKGERYGNGRSIGFHWTEGTLFIKLWEDPMEWRAKDPKWWAFSICPADILLGRSEHSSRTLDKGIRQLAMPEKVYDVQIEITEDVWKRPRWPWPYKVVRTHSEVEGGIPVPGKGTTDYNCGPDAIYSQTSPGTTFDAALANLYRSVSHNRERYPL